MDIVPQDPHVFYQEVHQIAAKQLGIKNHECKSDGELVDEIQIANSAVARKIKSFIAAYDLWLKVLEESDSAGTIGNSSSEKNRKLLEVISARDSTRKDLISELENL